MQKASFNSIQARKYKFLALIFFLECVSKCRHAKPAEVATKIKGGRGVTFGQTWGRGHFLSFLQALQPIHGRMYLWTV